VPLGLYIIAPKIHGNKLVLNGVTVNIDTRKVELSLWERKLQNPDQPYF
jgi:hypothetical protein